MTLLADATAQQIPTVHFIIFNLLGWAGLLLFFYGIGCFLISLRHKQAEIPWTWVMKTYLKRANFNERGQMLRQRWARFGMIGFLLLVLGGYYQKFMTQKHAGSQKPPAASRDY